MNKYLVNLTLVCDVVEKGGLCVAVKATSTEAAVQTAIISLSNNPHTLEWDGRNALESSGEFGFKDATIHDLTEEQFSVMQTCGVTTVVEPHEWVLALYTSRVAYLGSADISAYLLSNGSVEVNLKGQERFLYEDVSDFIKGYIESCDSVQVMTSVYMGMRDEEFGLELRGDTKHLDIDENEDGTCVYSIFYKVVPEAA